MQHHELILNDSKKKRVWSFRLNSKLFMHQLYLMHQHRQADGWCVYICWHKGLVTLTSNVRSQAGLAVITSENTAQFFGCRFWLKKQLYPSVSIENDFLTWRQSQRSGWAWLILSVHADIRFPSRQSLANWKMELNHQSSSHNQQKKNKTSQRKATSL